MKKVLKDLRGMLTSDGGDKLSSKRVITFIAFILVAIAFVGSLFFGLEVEISILTGMINIVFAGLGVTVSEHLLKKKNGEYTPTSKPQSQDGRINDQDELGDN